MRAQSGIYIMYVYMVEYTFAQDVILISPLIPEDVLEPLCRNDTEGKKKLSISKYKIILYPLPRPPPPPPPQYYFLL